MSLSHRLHEFISAAFTGLWVQSHEHEDALAEITRLCRDHSWPLAIWDIDLGFQTAGATAEASASPADPIAAIHALASLANPNGSALLVLPNFHRFLHSAEVVQALAHAIHQGRADRTFVVILSPVVQIPIELEKHFAVIEHDLPDRPQLEEIARGVATEAGELPEGAALSAVLDAAAGLTRIEAENAFSLSLVRQKKIAAEAVWDLKTQALKKSGLISLHRGGEGFGQIGGLESLKTFCKRAMRPGRDRHAKARGVLLLGVPGTGKSFFAKALGNEVGRPTLLLDVGALMGSLVGQTEQNIRHALRIADAMAPAILFCDEIEKGLSGVASSGQTDSGVSARLFGSLLTWLSDHDSDVFFIGTSNDVSKLPPEFSRAERFDGVFFLELPSTAERAEIWKLYLSTYRLNPDQPKPTDRDWTGAEIKSCCRLASLLDISLVEAGKNIVPVAVTASESVQRLRKWASGRCLSACEQGIYQFGDAPTTPKRRVSRQPASN